jgi:acetyl-CoA C-acetyltransferase
MSDPIWIHAAARSKSYGYKIEHGYSIEEIRRPVSRLLSVPASDILRAVPVPIDAIFVSNQIPDRSGSEELVVNQLVDSLSCDDQSGKQLRLNGITCVRVETATNGLTTLRTAIDYLQAGNGDTVLVIGGEKLTPTEFEKEDYYSKEFDGWAARIIQYIGSALAPYDRTYCRSMPAAMALILNYYARTRWIGYDRLKNLIRQLSIRAYKNVLKNKYAFQRHHKLFEGRAIEAVYADEDANPMLVYPLRKLDMSPFNDGAGALLLSRRHKLEMLDGNISTADVMITGCAVAQDRLSLTERKSLDSFPATKLAAKRAYAQAGLDLRKWQTELAPLILEQHDAFVPLTLINLEDLLLFNTHWDVIRYLEEEYLTNERGPLLLNPSGGLLEGHPFAGTAIIKIVECFARLTAKREFAGWLAPGDFGDEATKTAIVQSFGGIGANVGVAVLDRCDEKTGKMIRTRGDVSHYSNLGSRLEAVETQAGKAPVSGRVVSLSRIKMPFIGHEEQFKLPEGETVLALVQTSQGKVYAFAMPGSEEVKLTPEELCDKDIDVRLHKVDDFLSFRIERSAVRKPIKFRVVA